MDRVIDAVLDAGLGKGRTTSFEFRRVKERMPPDGHLPYDPQPQIPAQPAGHLSGRSWAKTTLSWLSSPQALSEAASAGRPQQSGQENSILIYYLKDRLDFPLHLLRLNLAEIRSSLLSDGFCELVPNAHAHGFKVAPWPVGNDSRDDLRQLFRLDPELVVTNKPEVAVSILTGLGQWDESSKEG